MPQSLLNFVYQFNARTHLIFAMILGLFARLMCVFFVYGPQALDDYKHGFIPAFQKAYHLTSTLPDYRNPLLHEVLSQFITWGHLIGVSSALGETRLMMVGLALISMLGIWGVYRTAYAHQKHEATVIAVYLMSIQGIMPFVSTRAFGEVVAMSLLIFGIGIIEKERFKLRSHTVLYVWGWFVIGVSCLFRYHVGLIAASLLCYYLFKKQKKIWVSALIAAGFVLLLQYWIDVRHSQTFLHSFLTYLRINEGGAAGYGTSPWYNTWILALAFTLFPFSLVFLKKVPDVLYEYFPLVISLFIFVLAHSIVPHKEERFLYPCLGIIWVLLGYAWGHSFKSGWVKNFYFPVFIIVNSILLVISTTNNTQGGEIEPLFKVEKEADRFLILDDESVLNQSRITEYFTRRNSALVAYSDDLKDKWNAKESINGFKFDTLSIVTSNKDRLPYLKQVRDSLSTTQKCSSIETAGSFTDGLLYKLNPKHNQRRRPTWFFYCKYS